MDLIIEFKGSDADRHLLRAYEGSESLEGFVRALTLVKHYAITGAVRKRYPFDNTVLMYIASNDPGSFKSIIRFITAPGNPHITSIGGATTLAIFTGIMTSLLQTTFSAATGQDHTPTNPVVRQEAAQRSGNIEALTDAVQPSLRRAHTIINNGAGTINIYNGEVRLSHFDARTKAYLEETVFDRTVRRKEVSVSMLNASTRNGRIFDFELGRTIPIRVINQVPAGTIPTLATSLRSYSLRRDHLTNSRGIVIITYTMETTTDGTPKRYLVQGAEIPQLEAPRR